MKLFALLTSMSVLAATHATAETVQLTLTYNNITEVFYPDADFMSGDGYAYDPTNPLNDPTDLQYDANYSSRQAEAREDMLQQIFGDGRQNGGATFVSGDNRWDYTPVTPYSIELTLVVDKSLFDLTTNFFTTANGPGNASGFNALGQLNTPISYEKLANGTTVDSATLFNSTLYGARRGLDVGNGDTADALAIGFGE